MKSLAFVFRCLVPGYFRRDFECIQRIAVAKNKTEVIGIAHRLPFDPRFSQGFFRGFLHLRISDRLVMQMANRVF